MVPATRRFHPIQRMNDLQTKTGLEQGLGRRWTERIGNTPLLRLESVMREFPGVCLLAKAEWVNPGGSVKDRAAANIVAEARRQGQLGRGRILLDATSGNTGIAYAMLGAAQGFPVTLCMPSNVSEERKRILGAYGARIVYTDPAEGTDGAIMKARELAAAEPQRYFYADQYSNDANWRAHYLGTANEIWEQTGGRVTHFVAMLGTSGTFMGTTRRLRELNPQIRCISVQPDAPFHGIEGAKYMPAALAPKIYDPTLADENLEVSTEEAYCMVRRLAREEGLLVGVSAGGAIAACLQVAARLCESREYEAPVIVTLLPDSGERYLSQRFWAEF
jgi:cysteine synthase B